LKTFGCIVILFSFIIYFATILLYLQFSLGADDDDTYSNDLFRHWLEDILKCSEWNWI